MALLLLLVQWQVEDGGKVVLLLLCHTHCFQMKGNRVIINNIKWLDNGEGNTQCLVCKLLQVLQL